MHHRPLAILATSLVVALFGALLGPAGMPLGVGMVRAAGVQPPRVVVVVGPTHGLTTSNLQWGEAIAERAAAQGAQVVRVFHPHATWAAVSAAAAGANVLVYLGHGNGYPSPYTSTLMPDRQDGMGLDPVDGAADDQVQYYGEQYMAMLHLAPNALVVLNHLCYASGNSEPGQPEPTAGVAVERVDNFAAGFLAGGAGAVLALGLQDAGDIVAALFGPPQTLDQLFMASGGIGAAPLTTASTRTPGAWLHLDPDSATAGFYRSLAGNLDLLTSQVLSGAGGATALPPAGLSPAPASTPAVPPTPAVPQSPASDQPPVLSAFSAPSAFTPNGDGISDTLTASYQISAPGTLEISIIAASGAVVRHLVVAATSDAGQATWDGRGDDGLVVPDGTYALVATPLSAIGLPGAALTIHTRVLTAIRAPRATPAVFYPLDRGGGSDLTTLSVTLTQAATVSWTVTDASGRVVRTLWERRAVPAGAWVTSWDGRGAAGGGKTLAPLPVGRYLSAIAATTAAGTVVMRSVIWLMPFRLTLSTATAAARQLVSVAIVSAEPLRAAPRLLVLQPGLPAYAVTAAPIGGFAYRAVFRLRAGLPGTVQLRAIGTDRAGNLLSMAASLALR